MSIRPFKTHSTITAVQRSSNWGSQKMLKKYFIPFLICIITLVFSEYYFLQEVTSRQRPSVLALTIVGIGGSIFIFSLLYKKLSKTGG